MHLTRGDIKDVFQCKLGDAPSDDPGELTMVARRGTRVDRGRRQARVGDGHEGKGEGDPARGGGRYAAIGATGT